MGSRCQKGSVSLCRAVLSFFIPSFLSPLSSFFLIFILRKFEINKKDYEVSPVDNSAWFRVLFSMISDFSFSLPLSYFRALQIVGNGEQCKNCVVVFC